MKLEIESRHSDWGEDAGGYSVLRFNDEWVGRISNREAAEKLIQHVDSLTKALRGAWHALKSYEYGNSATELAKEATEAIEQMGVIGHGM
jgi:hypothetical protein